jgi:uncharacterized secreted protein with C-terminal beta-propeller domain
VRPAAVILALLVLVAAAPAEAARKRAKSPRLKAFTSCANLISYARRHAPPPVPRPIARPLPPRIPLPEALPESGAEGGGAAPDSSTTNVQEAGVDEPDIVKNDGRTMYALVDGRLHAVDAASSRKLSSVAIPGGFGDFLIQGRRALTIASGGKGTILTEIDIANPAAMRVLRTFNIDGSYVSARLHGRTVRVVLSSEPRALDTPIVFAARKPLRARRAGWVPSATLRNRRTGRKRTGPLVACDDVRRTPRFTGAGMLTVLTVDLERGLPAVDSDSVLTNADTVYASPTSVYVATSGGWLRDDTSIHRFDIAGPQRTDYRASGQVPGELLNQFSLSEYNGVLRAATTEGFDDDAESHVTALQTRAGRLEKIGQVSGLGRGERIYAVRFIGDRGYVVTFRQVDPLYTLDLADPAKPRVRGELKILGYSAYLHPVGDHELVGIGQDADAQGRQEGTQLSLFDVDDPANPRLLHKVKLGLETSSEAEYDHHAFLWWEPLRLAVVPVTDFDGDEPAQAIGFRVDRTAGIAEAGRTSEAADVLRTLVVGGRLFTLTGEGLHAYDLNTLAPGPLTRF